MHLFILIIKIPRERAFLLGHLHHQQQRAGLRFLVTVLRGYQRHNTTPQPHKHPHMQQETCNPTRNSITQHANLRFRVTFPARVKHTHAHMQRISRNMKHTSKPNTQTWAEFYCNCPARYQRHNTTPTHAHMQRASRTRNTTCNAHHATLNTQQATR